MWSRGEGRCIEAFPLLLSTSCSSDGGGAGPQVCPASGACGCLRMCVFYLVAGVMIMRKSLVNG